jgi:hypothetical protein
MLIDINVSFAVAYGVDYGDLEQGVDIGSWPGDAR